MHASYRPDFSALAAVLLAGCLLLPACGSAEPEPPDVADPRNPEPAPWEAPGSYDASAFPSGVQVSDVTADAALVSTWSSEPLLGLTLVEGSANGWSEHTQLEDQALADEHISLELTGLQPDRAYSLVFTTADAQRRSAVTRFRTALAEDQRSVLRFGASSCMGSEDWPWPNLSRAAGAQHDFFLLLGDTVYADSATDLQSYRAKWRQAFAGQGLQDLFASTSVVSTWDDHEVSNNWTWNDEGIEQRFAAAIQAYKDAIPWREGPGGTGIWRSLRWGRSIEIFVLDSRGETRDGNYVSPQQMDWLKTALSASPSRFKLIMTSVPITDVSDLVGNFLSSERWQGYPEQRREILDHILAEGIEGVLWIAGDFHYGQVARVDPPGGASAAAFEVQVGPSGSHLSPIAVLYEPNEQFLHFVSTWNYVDFLADPLAGTIEVRFIDDDGAILAEQLLHL
jgi:phosphodiesterase/alkaline phosphatase D-like protein